MTSRGHIWPRWSDLTSSAQPFWSSRNIFEVHNTVHISLRLTRSQNGVLRQHPIISIALSFGSDLTRQPNCAESAESMDGNKCRVCGIPIESIGNILGWCISLNGITTQRLGKAFKLLYCTSWNFYEASPHPLHRSIPFKVHIRLILKESHLKLSNLMSMNQRVDMTS